MPGVFHWVTSFAEARSFENSLDPSALWFCDRLGSGKSQRGIHSSCCKRQRVVNARDHELDGRCG